MHTSNYNYQIYQILVTYHWVDVKVCLKLQILFLNIHVEEAKTVMTHLRELFVSCPEQLNR